MKRYLSTFMIMALWAPVAYAQQVLTLGAPATTSVDLTQVLIVIIGGVFTIVTTVLGAWLTYIVNKNIQDKQAALAVSNAVKNALGKIQQAGQAAAEGEIQQLHPHLNVPDYLAPGVQYVLDHAGTEAARFGLTPEGIADKIVAQLGLKNMETNLAITQASTPVTRTQGDMTMMAPVVAGPLAPVPQAVTVIDATPLSPEKPSSETGTKS